MTDKKRKAKHGAAYNAVREIWRRVTGETYKRFRDETTGRFLSSKQAEKQKGTGNVMTHRVKMTKKPKRTNGGLGKFHKAVKETEARIREVKEEIARGGKSRKPRFRI